MRVPLPRRPIARLLALVLLAAAAWAFRQAGPALVVRVDPGPPDAIVMLASHEWERLPATAALAARFPDSQVLLTIPRRITALNCFRCLERIEWLQAEGVGGSRIAQLPWPTTSTYDEAVAVRRLWDHRHFGRILVVTSPYHTRRALSTFRAVFGERAVAIGVEPALATSEARPSTWWWHEYDRDYVLYEWAAILFYRVRFRVPLFKG